MYNYHTAIKIFVGHLAQARQNLKKAERDAWDARNKAQAKHSKTYERETAPSQKTYDDAIEAAWQARDEQVAIATKNLVETICQQKTQQS